MYIHPGRLEWAIPLLFTPREAREASQDPRNSTQEAREASQDPNNEPRRLERPLRTLRTVT